MGDDQTGAGDDQRRNQSDRRIKIAGARRMLGMISRNYDDDQILEILDILYGMAEISYDEHLKAQNSSDERAQ